MKQHLIILILGFSLSAFSQYEYETIKYPVKAIYKICINNPNDTILRYSYSYDSLNRLTKVDKYEKNILSSYCIYKYDNYLIYKEPILVFNLVDFCSKNDSNKSEIKFIKAYGGDNYTYDSIKNILYVSNGNVSINNLQLDSTFVDAKLILIKENKDTLSTFEYNKKGKLIKEYNFINNKIFQWKEFKYKKNTIYEYYFHPINKHYFKSIVYTYNDNNMLIQKLETFWYNDLKEQPYNNYILEKYSYIKDQIKTIERHYNYNDPGFDLCGGSFVDIYEYIK